ncbi:hypothetical protein BX600DRAFT_26677 [Xylariales sp. PMI_506]|nr:hypothetical protein BX600DRAFT_26677 [Xylariales sp. PMI_506]
MKFSVGTVTLALLGVASARPDAVRSVPDVQRVSSAKFRREVPQEHSHEQFITTVRTSLNLNNPEKIQDPIFSLLGNAAAAAGAGTVTNLDCLQQHVADQAFTNSKAAGDVAGMTAALIFRALERNTGSVGLASVLCNETATNPEIASVTQHQDPASSGAAATNKAIVLNLASQIASVGGDPQDALKSGTFAPGTIGDTTGAGHTCDDATDTTGCIFTQNLLVEDATAAEITAAVGTGGTATASNSTSTATGASSSTTASAASTATSTATATTSDGVDVNKFTGSLNSAPVPVISSAAERPFSVNGDTFLNIGAATQRACDVQKNACANVANSGGGGTVADCDTQHDECIAANAVAARMRRATHAHVRRMLHSRRHV